jgi:glycosyltransferase involved in cell wall biosynthesis
MAKGMKRKKLLIITERFHPEQFLINEMVPQFTASGFDVTVLTQAPSYPMDTLYHGYTNRLLTKTHELSATVYRVRTVLGYKKSVVKKIINYVSFAFLACVALIITGRSYHSVLVFQTGPLTQAVPLLFVRGARGRRCLWTQDVWPDTVFEYGFPEKGGLAAVVKALVTIIYRHCDSIAVTSPGFMDSVVRYAARNVRVLYIPQWAPQQLLDPPVPGHLARPERSSQAEVLFRFAGSIGTMQNLEIVLRAFAMARAKDSRLVLEIIGDGSEKERLEHLARELGLDSVLFTGRLPMADVMPLLKESDFLVLPLVGKGTVGKTIPAKFQAYLAAARPIFGVLAGPVAEMIEKESLGFVASPISVDEVSEGFLVAAASSTHQRAAISRRETAFLAATFSRQKAMDKFVECVS